MLSCGGHLVLLMLIFVTTVLLYWAAFNGGLFLGCGLCTAWASCLNGDAEVKERPADGETSRVLAQRPQLPALEGQVDVSFLHQRKRLERFHPEGDFGSSLLEGNVGDAIHPPLRVWEWKRRLQEVLAQIRFGFILSAFGPAASQRATCGGWKNTTESGRFTDTPTEQGSSEPGPAVGWGNTSNPEPKSFKIQESKWRMSRVGFQRDSL